MANGCCMLSCRRMFTLRRLRPHRYSLCGSPSREVHHNQYWKLVDTSSTPAQFILGVPAWWLSELQTERNSSLRPSTRLKAADRRLPRWRLTPAAIGTAGPCLLTAPALLC